MIIRWSHMFHAKFVQILKISFVLDVHIPLIFFYIWTQENSALCVKVRKGETPSYNACISRGMYRFEEP